MARNTVAEMEALNASKSPAELRDLDGPDKGWRFDEAAQKLVVNTGRWEVDAEGVIVPVDKGTEDPYGKGTVYEADGIIRTDSKSRPEDEVEE